MLQRALSFPPAESVPGILTPSTWHSDVLDSTKSPGSHTACRSQDSHLEILVRNQWIQDVQPAWG